ncbi:MAG TPA: hypothetical protein VGD56_12640, partial [Gemmatirosa sp.]
MLPLVVAGLLAAATASHTPLRTAPGATAPREVRPVLAFPQPGLDDSAAYAGYQTRLFRDAANNTVQVYLDGRDGRVVHVLADAENESVGFTARGADDRPAPLTWAGDGAVVSEARRVRAGSVRTFTYDLAARTPTLRVGLFVLTSMRVEREVQDHKQHLAPLGAGVPTVAEYDTLFAALGQLPPDVQHEHLALLGARDVATLRMRVRPRLTLVRSPSTDRTRAGVIVARVVQASLDGRDTLAIEFRADARAIDADLADDTFTLRARAGARTPASVRLQVTVTTTGRTLTPLGRGEIFTPD